MLYRRPAADAPLVPLLGRSVDDPTRGANAVRCFVLSHASQCHSRRLNGEIFGTGDVVQPAPFRAMLVQVRPYRGASGVRSTALSPAPCDSHLDEAPEDDWLARGAARGFDFVGLGTRAFVRSPISAAESDVALFALKGCTSPRFRAYAAQPRARFALGSAKFIRRRMFPARHRSWLRSPMSFVNQAHPQF
jgi:hypothetical protein